MAEIHGASGTIVRVRNHSRKNEQEKETYLPFNATMLHLKDVMGVSHKTDIFLSSIVNGREFFLTGDASLQGFLLMSHFGEGLISPNLKLRYKRKPKTNEQGVETERSAEAEGNLIVEADVEMDADDSTIDNVLRNLPSESDISFPSDVFDSIDPIQDSAIEEMLGSLIVDSDVEMEADGEDKSIVLHAYTVYMTCTYILRY
ncbi:uncharacterized protein LOC134818350 [Bolinopsis microptera]|uniref:uncharacterized protein LOC134818350 n=1 Tax=Bolinopsis microptera TaxID=2820187 RepID=UPI003078A653